MGGTEGTERTTGTQRKQRTRYRSLGLCGPLSPSSGAVEKEGFIPPHGGYKELLSYQKAEIVYDATIYFGDRFMDSRPYFGFQRTTVRRPVSSNCMLTQKLSMSLNRPKEDLSLANDGCV